MIHLVAVFSGIALALSTNAVATVVAQGGRRVVRPAFKESQMNKMELNSNNLAHYSHAPAACLKV